MESIPLVKHESCLEYLRRRLSEGWTWQPITKYLRILSSPGGCWRFLDLRHDIETLRPNAAGDETGIEAQTPSDGSHYDKVDEASPDDATTTVRTNNTTYERDLYNLPSLSGSPTTINSITIYFRCYRATSQNCYAKPTQKSGTTVTDGTEVSVTQTWTTYSQTYTTNPATGSAYTLSEINALQIGVCLRKDGTGALEVFCTQVYVEVNYTAITTKTSSDSGSGSEAKVTGSPLASLSSTESASGLESNPISAAILTGSETASGTEALLNLIGKLVSDSGSGSEVSYLEILAGAKSSSDSGSGTEISGLLAQFTQDEPASGNESLVARLLQHSDGGVSSETGLLLVALARSETASGYELILARLVATQEIGSGVDRLPGRQISLIDPGFTIESATVAKVLLVGDNGAGLEALTSLLASLATIERGYGAEKLGAKIMLSAGAGDMRLLQKKGKVATPFKGVNP